MRLRTLRLKGIGPFVNEVSLDLSGISGVCCVYGPNGAGKSTLLGAWAAALDRKFPARGGTRAIAELATARDSFVEAGFDAPTPYLIRQLADNATGDGESTVDGAVPAFASTSIAAYKKWTPIAMPWAIDVLPPQNGRRTSVFHNTVFAAQGAAGFLNLSRSERMAVLGIAIGADRYVGWTKAARDKATAAGLDADRIASRIAGEESSIVTVAKAEEDAANLRMAAERAVMAVENAQAALDEVRARHEALLAAFENAASAKAARGKAFAAHVAAKFTLAEIERKAGAQRVVLGDAAAVREAAAALPALESAKAGAEALLREAQEIVKATETAILDKRRDALRADDAAKRAREAGAAAQAASDELGRTRAVAATVASLETAAADAETKLRAAQDAVRACETAIAEKKRETQDADRRTIDKAVLGRDAQAAADELVKLRPVAEKVGEAREKLTWWEAELAKDRAEVERLTGATLDVAGRRIVGLRDGLKSIGEYDTEQSDATSGAVARATLSADDKTAGDAIDGLAALPVRKANLSVSEGEIRTWRGKLSLAETAAARLPDLEKAAAPLADLKAAEAADRKAADEARAAVASGTKELAAHKAHAASCDDALLAAASKFGAAKIASIRVPDLERAAAPLAEHRAAEAVARADADAARKVVEEETKRLATQRQAIDGLNLGHSDASSRFASAKQTSARAPEIAAAESALAEIESQLPAATASVATAEKALADAPEPPADVPPPPDVDEQTQALADAEGRAKAAHGTVAVAEAAVLRAREAEARVAGLRAELAAAERLTADWTRLERDFREIRALEVDAVGPEIAAVTTQILRDAFGPRWTPTLSTSRLNDKGDEIEECEVRLIDTVRGVDGTTEFLSGGEAVIVGEAITDAITFIACRRFGIEKPTLVRDEAGAALSPTDPLEGGDANVPALHAYLSMLKSVARVTGATVLLVAHDPSIPPLCDYRIRVENGAVHLEGAN